MYSQILICVSLLVASYQDVKERSVSDLVWLPALVGAGYTIITLYPDLLFLVLRMAWVGVIVAVFALSRRLGDADMIALVFFTVDPYRLSPLPAILFAGVFLVGHALYEFGVGNLGKKKKIPIERFLREQVWIPYAVVVGEERIEVSKDVNVSRDEVAAYESKDAMVEVKYGMPDVAYFGLGYLVYLIYLVVFNLPVFISLP
ncbi:MAG: hypothetical protein LYZ66_03260 [Nitrososphaerales archaeon]|nr:hypothetical protein [Nitrososphaerales archaeon]